MDRFSSPRNALRDFESEANEFASQLLLPPTLVRQWCEDGAFSLERLRALSAATGASLTAAAIASVAISSAPIGFAVVKDGFVKWGRASDAAFKRGVSFQGGREVPSLSRFSSEFGAMIELEAQTDVIGWGMGWGSDERCLESGFFSARLQQSIVCMDFRNKA